MTALPASTVVGVVGAGTMGAGIAQVAAVAGHRVLLTDIRPGAAAAAVKAVRERLAAGVEKGWVTQRIADDAGARLTAVANLGSCGLVLEAVAEDLTIKRQVFADVEQMCPEDAVLATNTSSLSVTEIAEALSRPGRLAGMHFFNPAPRLPLVEVVAGAKTDQAVLDTLTDTARAWGKTPVRCADTPGFIVNRVARPFYGEAFRLLEANVADPTTIDAVFREAGGFRMGPCELTDLIGQDVNAAVTRRMWEAYDRDPRLAPSDWQEALVASGRLGAKTAGGIYDEKTSRQPSTAEPRPAPQRLVVNGAGGPLDALVLRLDSAGVPALRNGDAAPVRIRLAENVVLQLTDGRTAAAASADGEDTVVLVDLAADFGTARRLAVAAPADAPPSAADAAVGCLQAVGVAVTLLPDTPGLVLARTVAMLAAFGADAVDAGVASAADVDTAMRLGANYPRGPLEWGDSVGWDWVAGVLSALAASEEPGRYRMPDSVARRASAAEVRGG